MHFGGTHVRLNQTQYKQKGFTPILILVGIVVLAMVAGGAYYFGKSSVKLPTLQPQVSVSPTQSPTKNNGTANWKTYTNSKYNYELKYPSNWQLVNSDRSSIVLYPSTSDINSQFPQPGILVTVLTKPFAKPVEQFPAIKEIASITVSGVSGYKFSAQGAPFSTINVELPYQNGTLPI